MSTSVKKRIMTSVCGVGGIIGFEMGRFDDKLNNPTGLLYSQYN
jgi:F420-0:gamma-glutamyl ligase-like protein